MSRPPSLSSQAIKSLAAIILTAVLGIILLTAWSIALRAGVAGADLDAEALNAGNFDESLSILGNIAAASVGGLVGWLTRDLVYQASSTEDVPSEQKDEGS